LDVTSTWVDGLPPSLREQGVGEQLLERPTPDVDFLRSLVAQTMPAYVQRDPVVDQLLRVIEIGFSRFTDSPDPLAEATALGVRARLLREAEDMGTYSLARRIASLVGSDHLLTVQARDDAALALRANRYLDLAEKELAEARRNIASLPREVQASYAVSNISTVAAVVRSSTGRSDAAKRTESVRRALRGAINLIESGPDDSVTDWYATALRRLIQLELAAAVAQRERVRGRYRVPLPRAMPSWREEAARTAAAAVGSSWQMSWSLQEMRLALEERDRDAFWHYREQAVAYHQRQPWFPNLVLDLDALVKEAAQHGWRDPEPTELLVVGSVWLMKLVRTDRLGTV